MKFTAYSMLLTALLILSGCGSFHALPAKSTQAAPAPSASGQPGKVMRVAHGLLGAPYRYGGNSPKGFDCSGFTSYVFSKAGVHLPRTAAGQYRGSRRIKRNELAIGDLLFFRLSGRKITHVAIYAGDDRFIHSPSSGKKVSYGSLNNDYWNQRWVGAGRVF